MMGLLLKFIPKNLLSYWVGRLVRIKLAAPFDRLLVEWFAKRYKLNMNEAEFPLNHYTTIGDVFTRKLKPGARPIAQAPYVHPADSVLTARGQVKLGHLMQAKNKTYSLANFLVRDDAFKKFEEGHYLTYYLCPTDYHRVHSPVDGKIVGATHVPGRLWPVNPWSVENVSQLFSINERVIVWIETARGLIAVVLVGATNVGRMTLSFDTSIVSNNSHWRNVIQKKYPNPIPVARGQELGVFNMGSTVVVVTPPEFFKTIPPMEEGPLKVRLGEAFDVLKPLPAENSL